MGQEVIDFVHGDEKSDPAVNHTDFVGERVPDLSESVNGHIERLTGEGSDLALMIRNGRQFVETLNQSDVSTIITNALELSDTLKHQPWRLIWKGTKEYPEDEAKPPKKE
jgi:hypothetical protein